MKKLLLISIAGILFQSTSIAFAFAEKTMEPKTISFDCTYTLDDKKGHLALVLDISDNADPDHMMKVEATYDDSTSAGFCYPVISEDGKQGFNLGLSVTWPISLATATTQFTMGDLLYAESFQKKVFGYSSYKDTGEPIIQEITTMTCTLVAGTSAKN